jgi:hypothetical protein
MINTYNVHITDNDTQIEYTSIEVLARDTFDACKKALQIINNYLSGNFTAVVKC